MLLSECKKLSLAQIKKTDEYKAIPTKFGKSKLSKEELCKIIGDMHKSISKKSKSKSISPSTKANNEKRKELDTIIEKLTNDKLSKKDQEKLIEKFHLPTQKEYLIQKINIHQELNK